MIAFDIQHVKAIADSGVNVVVSGGKVSDLALHFANKYNLMVVRLTSKWDVRRLCRTVGATALPKVVGYFFVYTCLFCTPKKCVYFTIKTISSLFFIFILFTEFIPFLMKNSVFILIEQ